VSKAPPPPSSLAARPVYRFKDDTKGLVFKAVLKDVAVEGDELVVVASLIRLSAAVAAWLGGPRWWCSAPPDSSLRGRGDQPLEGERRRNVNVRVLRYPRHQVPKALLRQKALLKQVRSASGHGGDAPAGALLTLRNI
jgi:hypothetical protein